MDWVTTSHNLVIGSGDRAGTKAWTWRGSATGARFSSGSGQNGADRDNTGLRACPGRCHSSPGPPPPALGSRPSAPQCRPSCALAGPSRPPSHGHEIPGHPLHSPLDPTGTAPPQVSGGPRRAPAPGDRSARWRRAAAAPAPPPPPPLGLLRTRPPNSVLAVPGRGQARLPASRGGGGALSPPDRARPATRGLVGETRPSSATPASGAGHPTPASPRSPDTPLGRALNPQSAAGLEGHSSWAAERG